MANITRTLQQDMAAFNEACDADESPMVSQMHTLDDAKDNAIAYMDAKRRFHSVNREVQALGEAGNHKKKNQIINDELRKATMAVNKAQRKLLEGLDNGALFVRSLT